MAGLFSFQKQHEAHSHVVTLTMCQGQVIVCDYGVCVSITDWLKNQGLTVVLWAELILYRRVKSKSKNAHSKKVWISLGLSRALSFEALTYHAGSQDNDVL